MLLSDILNKIPVIQVVGLPELVEIKKLSIDSRENLKEAVFFAIRGFKSDGHTFIPQAVSNGVSAIVVDTNDKEIDHLLKSNNIVKILVQNSRKALSQFADGFYTSPSSKLNLVGITGTKGKTTVSYYIKTILENAGRKVGLIGTNKNMIGSEEISTKLTTPEAHVINQLMDEMVKAECSDCVMEVSSHALELSRVADLDFNVGVFTNITSDHLDFHSTFENYLSSKKIFFDQLTKDSSLVYNKDDQNYKALTKDCKAPAVSYSFNNPSDIEIKNVNYSLDGTSFNLLYSESSYEVKTKLIGQFNAYNAAAAIGAGLSSGITIQKSIEGIYKTPQVPGRFEVLSSGNKRVIIDYSHTADSLEQALSAIKHIVNNDREVYTVFGCGGDRDKTKRPIMGEISERLSDFTFVTSDNPRTEDPMVIISEIKKEMSQQKYKVVEDREEAIKSAIEQSSDDAVILIAGKGHENYQEINGVRNYFSDKETAEKYL